MAQVIAKRSILSNLVSKISGIFVIEPVSFSTKRRINFRGLGWMLCGFLSIFCLVVFLMPVPEEQTRNYHENIPESAQQTVGGSQPVSPSQYPLSAGAIHAQVSSGYMGGGVGNVGSQGANRNTSMIIGRDNDLSTTLPPGTKFWVKLAQPATVTNRTLPVIGVVAKTVTSGNSIAIPEGSQIFGEAMLDSDNERASVTWKAIMFPDGRSKNLSALALGFDNQAGVEGSYHSDALKNTAGQLIARFASGVAEGAITRTPFGASQGGIQNGLLQGAADTAKDRTDAWSEDMKKPRAWIELETGAQFQVILSQPFIFRDPGGVN
jgi:hypothetical protein